MKKFLSQGITDTIFELGTIFLREPTEGSTKPAAVAVGSSQPHSLLGPKAPFGFAIFRWSDQTVRTSSRLLQMIWTRAKRNYVHVPKMVVCVELKPLPNGEKWKIQIQTYHMIDVGTTCFEYSG